MSTPSSSSTPLEVFLLTLPEYKPSSVNRLSFLYSDFGRHRTSNVEGFRANVEWWRNLIVKVVGKGLQAGGSQSDKLVLHADEALLEGLRWGKVGRPVGLGTVMAELQQNHEAVPLAAFLSSPQSIYASSWPSWILSTVVKKPLWWGLKQLSIVSDEASQDGLTVWKSVKGDYVVVELLEQASRSVIAEIEQRPQLSALDRLYTLEGFKAQLAAKGLPDVTLSYRDITVLLRYMQRDVRSLVAEKDVIKLGSPQSLATERLEITEADRGYLQVKETHFRIEKQIGEVEGRINERNEKIASYLKANKRELAKSHLRSRKTLEDLLVKRTNALETLYTVLTKMETAAGDVEIMQAYSTSTSTLKSLLAHPMLQMDAVDETMDGLSEALADQKEIEDAMALGGEQASRAAGVEEVELEELERELEELQKQEQEEKEKEKETARREAEEQHRKKEAEEEQNRRNAEWKAAEAKEAAKKVEADTGAKESVAEEAKDERMAEDAVPAA